jgi:hypothetical protein
LVEIDRYGGAEIGVLTHDPQSFQEHFTANTAYEWNLPWFFHFGLSVYPGEIRASICAFGKET